MPSSSIFPAGSSFEDRSLLGVLGKVPDPRDRRGVRYGLSGVLAVAVCAVLAGARSFAAIAEFAADLEVDQLGRLGLGKAPVESTMRKLLARVDPAALDAALAVFTWSRVCSNKRTLYWYDVRAPNGARGSTVACRSTPPS